MQNRRKCKHKDAIKVFGWIFFFFYVMPLGEKCIKRVNMDFPVYHNVEDARKRVYPII